MSFPTGWHLIRIFWHIPDYHHSSSTLCTYLRANHPITTFPALCHSPFLGMPSCVAHLDLCRNPGWGGVDPQGGVAVLSVQTSKFHCVTAGEAEQRCQAGGDVC